MNTVPPISKERKWLLRELTGVPEGNPRAVLEHRGISVEGLRGKKKDCVKVGIKRTR